MDVTRVIGSGCCDGLDPAAELGMEAERRGERSVSRTAGTKEASEADEAAKGVDAAEVYRGADKGCTDNGVNAACGC